MQLTIFGRPIVILSQPKPGCFYFRFKDGELVSGCTTATLAKENTYRQVQRVLRYTRFNTHLD